MKALTNIVTIFLIMILTSCASFNPETTTSSHFINIHKNPKAGDYAIRTIKLGEHRTLIKWEVLKVKGDKILIKRSYPNDSDLKEIENEFLLNRQGLVLEAWLIYKKKRYTQKIVQPPSLGSLEDLKSEKFQKDNLKTPAGSFKITQRQSYTHRADLKFMKVTSASVLYLSEKVPFKIVQLRSQFGVDKGHFLQALEVTTSFLEGRIEDKFSDIHKLFNKFYKEEDDSGVNYETLVEFGWGK